MCKIARSDLCSLQAIARYHEVVFDKRHVPGAAWIGTKVLSLAVDAARHLPKMDVLTGVDGVFCGLLGGCSWAAPDGGLPGGGG